MVYLSDVAPAERRPRLIDARQIRYSWMIDADGEEHDGVTLQSIIDKMPTVDAVEIVRCKDCEYHEERNLHGVVRYDCKLAFYPFALKADDYCSNGKRKERFDENGNL